MRLIDADKLVDMLEAYQVMTGQIADFDDEVTKARCEGYEMALRNVNEYAKGANVLGSAWINVADQLPDSGVTVLAVKELKSGRRNVTLAYCIREYDIYDPVTGTSSTEPYWVCGGGNNHIIWWMPLPEPPEVTDDDA